MAISTHNREHAGSEPSTHRAGEVFRVFARLGVTAFGGPVAHIAAMQDEIVRRRGWVSDEEFADLMSAANVIPGPNSTELAIHLGYRRAGWPGLIAAGVAFIVPSTLIVWMIAIAYVRYGHRPEVSAILSGMQPVVLAVVVQALWRLTRGALTSTRLLAIGAICTIALFLGLHELLVLALGAALGVASAWRETARRSPTVGPNASSTPKPPRPALALGASGAVVATATQLPSTFAVFTAFAKIGSVLFGSGYVLLAFLRSEFVQRHQWLTERQLLDAIAIGQVTPGPVFTSATFVGYLLNGHAGALAATLGIFLPAFVFVAVSGPWVRQVRQSPRAAAALDGLNGASIALMLTVVVQMVPPVTATWTGMAIFVLSGVVLLRTTLGAGWILLFGALVGIVHAVILSAGVS